MEERMAKRTIVIARCAKTDRIASFLEALSSGSARRFSNPEEKGIDHRH
jgi:hypothetical protein